MSETGGYEPSDQEIEAAYQKLKKDVEPKGYFLNPDESFTKDLIRGMLINEKRYGYWSCPCRLASGSKEEDRDIICPCDYRDPDLDDFGTCYCALYVSGAVLKGEQKVSSIPERRPPPDERKVLSEKPAGTGPVSALAYPVWRCKVCGYLCAREKPPEVCPICKAKRDRFHRFM
ncbi:MAG: ferredoxin-thioredoxin reductase catalytic domain-containing protein [Syntrophales bacterium]|nr:ferredoxin-thioredoxin reductase catalytic domain-containing protein [Syntrophales bacterium]MDD5531427.1 ferredoxin-thioredoxin reductase catalytic domain-containing protein [Syntrophales bacterium]HPL62132.1 ferredoxin-thioredoxin reductase catalytic domain-containing protein [Syntrophales bacterium]